jgi:signal transduction histidine kinase
MSGNPGKRGRENAKASKDLIIFLAVIIPVFVLAHFLNLFGTFAEHTQRYEAYELEILSALVILITALSIFSLRRVQELRKEIAKRRRVEEELRLRNEELEEFSHTISHDLQNPLTIMRGYAEVAQQASTGGDPGLESESLEHIIQSTQKLSSLIESLLAYAQAGRPEGQIARVNPGEMIEDILAEYRENIREKNVTISVQESFPIILADPYKLRQVLSNLIGNAFKYLGDNPEPRIELGATEAEGWVTVYVRDNGVGIHYEEREAVFEPFKRSDTVDSPGQGIGLSIVKRAVEGWGGKVWVESAPGEGSTFSFSASAS